MVEAIEVIEEEVLETIDIHMENAMILPNDHQGEIVNRKDNQNMFSSFEDNVEKTNVRRVDSRQGLDSIASH